MENFIPFIQSKTLTELPTNETPNTWDKSFCQADGIKYGIAAPMPNAPISDTMPLGNEVAYLTLIYSSNGTFNTVRQIVLFGEHLCAIDMKPSLFAPNLAEYFEAIYVLNNAVPTIETLRIAKHIPFSSQFVENTIFSITDPAQIVGDQIPSTLTVRSGINAFGKFPISEGFHMIPHWLMHTSVLQISDLKDSIRFVGNMYITGIFAPASPLIIDWITNLPAPSNDPYPEYDINLIPFIHHQFPTWGYECVPRYLAWYTNKYINMPIKAVTCENGTEIVDCSGNVEKFKWPYAVGTPPPNSNPEGPYKAVEFNGQIAMFDGNKVSCVNTVEWLTDQNDENIKNFFWPNGEFGMVFDRTFDMQEPAVEWNVITARPTNPRVDTFGYSFRNGEPTSIIPIKSDSKVHRIILNSETNYEPTYTELGSTTDYADSAILSGSIYGHLGLTPIQLWAINPETHYKYNQPKTPMLIYACVAVLEFEEEYAMFISLGEVTAVLFTHRSNLAHNVAIINVGGVSQLSITNWPMPLNHYDYLNSQLINSSAKPYFYTAYATMNYEGTQYLGGTDWPEWTRFLINPEKVEWTETLQQPAIFTGASIQFVKLSLGEMRSQPAASYEQLSQLLPNANDAIHEPFLSCNYGLLAPETKEFTWWSGEKYNVASGLITCDSTNKFDKMKNKQTITCDDKMQTLNIPLDTSSTIYKNPKTNLLETNATAPIEFPFEGECVNVTENFPEFITQFASKTKHEAEATYAKFLPKFNIDTHSITYTKDQANFSLLKPHEKYYNKRGIIAQTTRKASKNH